MRTYRKPRRGFSLAKGPAGILGLALIACGVLGYLFAGDSFTANPPDGLVPSDTWLGIETNGWTDVLFAGAGLLVLLGTPTHWGAKSASLISGLVLGAAAIISLIRDGDIFGIFAANNRTALVMAIAGAALLIVALLPRVGRREVVTDRTVTAPEDATVPRRTGRFRRNRDRDVVADRDRETVV